MSVVWSVPSLMFLQEGFLYGGVRRVCIGRAKAMGMGCGGGGGWFRWRGTGCGCFGSEEGYFELDPLWDREPVEVLEDGVDVIMAVGEVERASSRVLEVLEFIQELGWCAMEDAVAIVNSGRDEGVDQGF